MKNKSHSQQNRLSLQPQLPEKERKIQPTKHNSPELFGIAFINRIFHDVLVLIHIQVRPKKNY